MPRSAAVSLRWPLALLFWVLAIGYAPLLLTPAASADDAADVKAVATQYYTNLFARNAAAVMALWSEKSPDYTSQKTGVAAFVQQHDKIHYENFSITRIQITGDQATLRVAFDMSSVHTDTGQPCPDPIRHIRKFTLVREAGGWKVWKLGPAAVELSDALLAAKTEAERQALLAADKELLTEELPRALIQRGEKEADQGHNAEALRAFELARAMAQRIGDRTREQQALNDLGFLHLQQAHYAVALQTFEEALKLAEAAGDKKGVGAALREIANAHAAQGHKAEALQTYERARAVAHGADDPIGEGVALHGIWQLQMQEQQYAAALETGSTRLKLAEAAGDKRAISAALRDIATVQAAQKQYAEALQSLDRARSVAREVHDGTGEGESLHRIGHIYQNQERYDEAREVWGEWLKLAEASGDNRAMNTALRDLGSAYSDQARDAEAIQMYERARVAAREAGDLFGHGDALERLGGLYMKEGRFATAIETWGEWLKLAEAADDKRAACAALKHIGDAQQEQGNYAVAMELFEKSLKQGELAGDKAGMADTLKHIGEVHHSQGNLAQALEIYQKSLALFQEAGSRWGVADLHNNIGGIYNQQGNKARAMEYFQESLKLWEELGNKDGMSYPMHHIGMLYAEQGNYEKALEFVQKAQAITAGQGDKTRPGTAAIGWIHFLQGHYDQALEYFQKNLANFREIGHKPGIANALESIGDIYRKQGKHAQALEFYQKSLTAWEALGRPTAQCYRGMGDVYQALGRTEEAMEAYRKAIARIEEVRSHVAGGEEEKLAFLHSDERLEAYQSLATLLAKQGNTAEALSILERARSKQLIDGLRLSALTVRDEKLRELLRKTEQLEQALAAQEKVRLAEISKPEERQDKTRVASLSQSVARTKQELLQVTNTIGEVNPDYKHLVTVGVRDLSTLQKKLPPNVVVVEYVPLETALTIFLITDQSAQARSVAVSRQRIEELVGAFHAEIRLAQRQGGENVRDWDWTGDRARRLRESLTALYGYLIAPIQADLAKAETVILIPSGLLHYLPFQALARVEGEKSLTFFGEEKRLAVLTSLGLWDRITEAAAEGNALGRGRLGAFGNPDGTLPNAEQEVKQVGALFDHPLVYVGAEATRARVESLPKDVGMAHFATHGVLSEQNLNECYLALANGEKLKLADLYGLEGRYPARLTVLSACETAVGRPEPGSEVAYLADGFLQAGSTTIVASLWQVSDVATAALMERFYQGLKAGKSKAEAKQAAEVSLLKEKATAHPYFWAPFVLIGDWR